MNTTKISNTFISNSNFTQATCDLTKKLSCLTGICILYESEKHDGMSKVKFFSTGYW